jgi:hypothetical protein
MNSSEYRSERVKMFENGYRPCVVHEDVDVATREPCPDCGSPCKYEGYRTKESYRAFSVCKACGAAIEF